MVYRGRPGDEDDDVGSAAREIATRWAAAITSYARLRPLESLIGAFLLGMLVVLLGRRGR